MDAHKVENVPNTVLYIPNFISEEEELEICSKVNSAPMPKWTQLSNRRLQNWGGVPHPKGMIAEIIPPWLKKYMEKVDDLGLLSNNLYLNHVLVNEYKIGQGIMPHLDGPLFYPTITTINCMSHTVLDFYHSSDTRNNVGSLLLERRSLLILQDSMYDNYSHGISENAEDVITSNIKNLEYTSKKFNEGDVITRGTRISLTMRHVPKTSRLKLRF